MTITITKKTMRYVVLGLVLGVLLYWKCHSYFAAPSFGGWKPVVVNPGDTVWTIGQKYLPNANLNDVRDAITDKNHIVGTIQPGETILVPTKEN